MSQTQLTFEQLIPAHFRQQIEQNFYATISERAKLEYIKKDPLFLKSPDKHIALYSDHGVVHVRDVATQCLAVIQQVNGVLIPERNQQDLAFIQGYTVLLAYLHDIGMFDLTEFGRFMHPEFAAQYVFSTAFESLLDHLWNENAGNIPWLLSRLFRKRNDEDQLKQIFREMLSLSLAHSKSKIPIDLLNNPAELKEHMHAILHTPLEQLYYIQKLRRLEQKGKTEEDPKTIKKRRKWEKGLKALQNKETPTHRQKGVTPDEFFWLNSNDEGIQRLCLNVIDSLRCIRAADALRQRGTVLRTSAGYEIFVDQNTANAIFALRSSDHQGLFLLQGKKPINAGEANLASSELDNDGNLHVSFHRGQFRNPRITRKAAKNVAVAINDIQGDTIQSFQRNMTQDRPHFDPPGKAFDDIKIVIEEVNDNPDFAEMVCDALEKLNPSLKPRLQRAVSLQGADILAVRRYLDAEDFQSRFNKKKERKEIVENIVAAGLNLENFDPKLAFQEVKVSQLNSREVLINSGTASSFVYVPLMEGLQVVPLGGYDNTAAPAWVPIGNTGVIRGSIRNATVLATTEVRVLIIPKEVYLRYWYTPYNPKSLAAFWSKK